MLLIFCLNHLQRNSIHMFLGQFFKSFKIINHKALHERFYTNYSAGGVAKETLLIADRNLSS